MNNIIGNIEVVWMTYNNIGIFIDEFLKYNKDVKYWIYNHSWFNEKDKLSNQLSKFVGADPFGVICFHRDALNEIIKPEYDILYESDIFCELRTPSILINSNFDILSNDKLVNVLVQPVKYTTDEGIFHQVKDKKDLHNQKPVI